MKKSLSVVTSRLRIAGVNTVVSQNRVTSRAPAALK